MDKERKEKEKRKRKKKGEQAKKEREEESERGRERNEKGGFSLVFQRSNPDGLRVKVHPRIVCYTWVPIFWSFLKLREVRNFPTWNILS